MNAGRSATAVAAALVALTVALVALAGCGVESPPTDPVSPLVVERIRSTSDCSALQREFDTAERNGHVPYMELAHEQLQARGCY